MAWVTTTYVDAFIGQGQRVALFGTTAVFDQFEIGARATVQSVLQYAGYEALGSTLSAGTITEAFLQKLVAAIMVRDAYAMRKGIQLPQAAQDAITQSAGLLDAIYAKRLPVPGLDPAAADGYGGVRFTPSSIYSVGGRPKRFNLRNTGF